MFVILCRIDDPRGLLKQIACNASRLFTVTNAVKPDPRYQHCPRKWIEHHFFLRRIGRVALEIRLIACSILDEGRINITDTGNVDLVSDIQRSVFKHMSRDGMVSPVIVVLDEGLDLASRSPGRK